MIGFAVRWAVPLIYIVTAASAVPVLFPSNFTRWWFRNRKFIGLTFAIAMAWQGTFIYIMSSFHRDYYFNDVYLLRNEIEGSIGYIFLAAMVLTSFKFGSKFVSGKQWKIIHKGGVYFLWAYAYTVYWWDLFYYPDPVLFQFIFYWLGFTAFALRIFAWGKKRLKQHNVTPSLQSSAFGYLFIILGLLLAQFGLLWREPTTNLLLSPNWSSNLELWLPFWPLEPFFCFFAIGLGIRLLTPEKTANAITA
jgi:DMSO/TMAO reductase YedYZ heme-binding membrane subunit